MRLYFAAPFATKKHWTGKSDYFVARVNYALMRKKKNFSCLAMVAVLG
jgi:hypothetical protein